MSCPPRPLRARPHPLRSPIPARRRFCVPRRPAPARPRSPCGLSLRPPASSAQPYPSVPRVLSVRRGKDGYWQGASACRARRVTLRARPRPLRGLSLPDAGSVCRVALRSPVFACAPRERRILAGSQRVPCPPRRPARRRPRPPHSPIPPCRGFCPSAAGRVDIGREPAHAVPAASPCAPARVLRAALSLRAAGFAHPPREGWILAGSQRVPCPPRRPARRPPASSAQPYPSVPRVLSVRRGKGGYWQRASAYRARRVTLRARPRPPRGLTLPDAGSVCRVALRPPVFPAPRGKGGYWN